MIHSFYHSMLSGVVLIMMLLSGGCKGKLNLPCQGRIEVFLFSHIYKTVCLRAPISFLSEAFMQ